MKWQSLLMLLSCVLQLGFVTDTVEASSSRIAVTVNGQKLAMVTAPVNRNYNLLIPLRTIAEATGADVAFDSRTKCITIIRANREVVVYLGKKQGTVNGEQFQLGVAPRTINETTMVPLRGVSEKLGLLVNWDAGKQTVQIEVDKGTHQITAKEYLAQAISATQSQTSYKFDGQSQMKLSAPTQPGSPAGTINLKYLIAGQTVGQDFYFTERNYLAGTGSYGDALEFLNQGQVLRLKVPGGKFEVAGDAEDVAMRQLKQHGFLILKNLQNYATIANYGNNNEGYEVLWVKLDEDLVKTNLLGLTPGSNAYARAQAVLSYRLVVVADTKLITRVAYSGYLVTPVGSKVVISSGDGTMAFTGFGETPQFPQI